MTACSTISRFCLLLAVVALSNFGLAVHPLAARSFGVAMGEIPSKDVVYVVQSGDTLATISDQYGIDKLLLIWYNRLVSEYVAPGQRLLIPVSATVVGRRLPTLHIVKAGDTLTGLSRLYGNSIEWIMTTNGLKTTTIRIGQPLVIPPIDIEARTERGMSPPRQIDPQAGQTLKFPIVELNPYQWQDYLIQAKAGQQISITLETQNLRTYFWVFSAEGRAIWRPEEPKQAWAGNFPKAGEYKIRVVTLNPWSTFFNLAITLDAESQTTATTQLPSACARMEKVKGNSQWLIDESAGFCLLYPSGFSADSLQVEQTFVVFHPPESPTQVIAYLAVDDANGMTVVELAELRAKVSQTAWPDHKFTVSTTRVQAIETVEHTYAPQTRIYQQVFLVHNDRLYTFTFEPDPANWSNSYQQMEQLKGMMLSTIHFYE